MSEPSEDGVGAKTPAEATTKEMVSTRLVSKAKAKVKARAKEIAIIAERQGIFRWSARTNRKARARAQDSKYHF